MVGLPRLWLVGRSGRAVYKLDNREKSNKDLKKLGSWGKFNNGIR